MGQRKLDKVFVNDSISSPVTYKNTVRVELFSCTLTHMSRKMWSISLPLHRTRLSGVGSLKYASEAHRANRSPAVIVRIVLIGKQHNLPPKIILN